VYEAGALNRPDKMQAQVINPKVVTIERKKDFGISDLFRISIFEFRISGLSRLGL